MEHQHGSVWNTKTYISVVFPHELLVEREAKRDDARRKSLLSIIIVVGLLDFFFAFHESNYNLSVDHAFKMRIRILQ
jgi:hypothetical protein